MATYCGADSSKAVWVFNVAFAVLLIPRLWSVFTFPGCSPLFPSCCFTSLARCLVVHLPGLWLSLAPVLTWLASHLLFSSFSIFFLFSYFSFPVSFLSLVVLTVAPKCSVFPPLTFTPYPPSRFRFSILLPFALFLSLSLPTRGF